MDKQQQQKLVAVTLAKPHEHAGQSHLAGASLQVTEPERDWLLEHGIINAPAAAKETK